MSDFSVADRSLTIVYFSLTNEAETKAELRDEQLTIPRLHVHFEAASGSKVAMGIPVARNKQVWRLVAFYFLAMIIFAFVHSVLSVIVRYQLEFDPDLNTW